MSQSLTRLRNELLAGATSKPTKPADSQYFANIRQLTQCQESAHYMTNPFQPSAAIDLKQATSSLAATVLLLLLATITIYLLWGDINFLLATQKGTLTKAGSVSFLHHMYLTMFPLEIAYFRLATSASVFIFLIFSLRNNQTFSSHVTPVYLYGIMQLVFYILAMTAILGILNQVSGSKLFEASYWSGPTVKPLAKPILVILAMHLLPPAAFLITCYTARSRINKQAKADLKL